MYSSPLKKKLFEYRSTVYNLRNFENSLDVLKPRTNHGKRSFSYYGVVLWNELPQNVRATCSLSQFKILLTSFLVWCLEGSSFARDSRRRAFAKNVEFCHLHVGTILYDDEIISYSMLL